MEVSFKDVKHLIEKCFHGAKSKRKVKIEARTTYSVNDYWDGGSRNKCGFINLMTMKTLGTQDIPKSERQQMGNPFNLPIAEVKISGAIAVIENSFFCGKDMGFRIYVSPEVFEYFQSHGLMKTLPESIK